MTLTVSPPSASASPEGPGALLRGVADGDRTCLAELYDLLAARVYGLLGRVMDTDAAQRALLDVFEEVWRTARECPADAEADAWVVRIARRRAVAAARALQARPTTSRTASPRSA